MSEGRTNTKVSGTSNEDWVYPRIDAHSFREACMHVHGAAQYDTNGKKQLVCAYCNPVNYCISLLGSWLRFNYDCALVTSPQKRKLVFERGSDHLLDESAK